MRHRALVDPLRDPSFALCPRLEFIDDQRRLLLTVDLETSTVALNFNLDPRPYAGPEVDVRFVLGWALLAKPEPRPVRV
jgi:hypothetical protein